MIEINAVTVRFGGLIALNAVSASLTAPVAGIIGPNGAGKTTLMNVVSGFITARSGRVGTLTAQARQDSEATGAILKQATDNRDSLSAVNLDEEAANLIKFEQYYNASAQIIQVARSLFDTLISSFR